MSNTRSRDEWASRLRELRIARGLSQEVVARAIGVSTGTVGSWERGLTRPYPRNLRRLARLLGVAVDALGPSG